MDNAPMTRREFLKRAGLIGLSLPFAGAILQACANTGGSNSAANTTFKLTWISPRGTLDVVDDYCHTIAMEMGYFKEFGIEPTFEGGPLEATAAPKMLSTKQGDMAYPSPGVIAASIAAGVPIISVFDITERDPFMFMVQPDSPIQGIKDLQGKKVSLGDAGWKVICDPLFKINGIDPNSIQYVAAGNNWGQAVQAGQADAALCWLGLGAQWRGAGLNLRSIENISPFPGNAYVIRKDDFNNADQKKKYINFLKACAMGLEWGKLNPRGAAQMSLKRFPLLAKQISPEVTLESVKEMLKANYGTAVDSNGWGYNIPEAWDKYVATLQDLGQLDKAVKAVDIYSNDWIKEINDFDRERVRKDAENFKLDSAFANLKA